MIRCLSILALAVLTGPASAADPDFNLDVRPILAAKCFKCHGPDEKSRKADLRLDIANDSGKKLVERIHSKEPDEVMPPPAVKKPLTDAEKKILADWVAAGAKYDPHWAFVPPKKSAAKSLDDIVRARLVKEGLKPSSEAEKTTLIRRVYLDLVGYPPAPAKVDAFLKDDSAAAFEKVVDHLLASPHYGERWARRWLDLARYADTNGYEKDRGRTVWPYRDWVIKALNDDMPFDRFSIEQLAGDMLPNPTRDQMVATTFHRNTMLNEEGGIDPLEFRYYAVVDRANVNGTVWLGLTMGCAQCHTHKFDPISHTEYFRLLSFMNNADEPDLELPTAEQTKRRAELESQIAKLEAALPEKLPAAERDKLFESWLAAQRKDAVKWSIVRPVKMEAGPSKLALQKDGSILAAGDAMKHDTYRLALADLPKGITAIRVEALTHDSLPDHGPGRAYYEGPKGDFLLGEFALAADGKPVKVKSAVATHGNPAPALDGQFQTGWPGAAKAGQPSIAYFILAEPLTAKGVELRLDFERHYSASLGRFRISVTDDLRELKVRDLPAEIEKLLTLEKLTDDQRAELLLHWAKNAKELKAARAEIDELRKQLPKPLSTLVIKERPADFPRQTFRHHRGEFLQPKEAVTPGGLAVLPPLPKDANRLTFAKWLVSRENPLVARVTVNRHWQAFFGRGIVRTTEDFGYQGEPPTNPELLDWLAVEFMDNGWSVKRLHKTIVMSATYRQSSRVTPELLARDPENKLLARGPRVRLDSEQLRDSLLKVSGLMSEKVGGPSVFPPQPAGAADGTYGAGPWNVSPGEDRYRRGLYTYTKRTAPFAMNTTFDGPSGESCLVRRETSNTPLQSLTMLNDVMHSDFTKALAKRAIEHKGTTEEQVGYLFRACLARSPKSDEVSLLVKFFESQKKRFAADEKRAIALVGEGKDAADRAAWAAVARTILNLDEFINKE
jgi:cytochrome c553